jgi:hypothetical protein
MYFSLRFFFKTKFTVDRQKTIDMYFSSTVTLPGRKSAFRARFGPDCYRESTKIRLRPAFGRPEGRFQSFPGSSPAKIWPGRPINGPEALLHNIEYLFISCNGSLEGVKSKFRI